MVKTSLSLLILLNLSCSSLVTRKAIGRCHQMSSFFSPRLPASLMRKCTDAAVGYQKIAQEVEFARRGSLLSILKPKRNNLSLFIENPEAKVLLTQRYPGVPIHELQRIKWLDLPYDLRESLLVVISKKVDYEKNRSLPGLVANRKLQITAIEDFRFQGVQYLEGIEYDLDLTDFLVETVEYATADVKEARAIEMHFRGEDAGQLKKDVEIFYEYIMPSVKGEREVFPVGLHQHVVGKVPKEYFGQLQKKGYDAKSIALAMTLTHQLYELGMIILNSKDGYLPVTTNNVDYLKRDKIPFIFDFFADLSIGDAKDIGTELKRNNVGIRFGKVYSSKDLWGFEFRYPAENIGLPHTNLAQSAYRALNHSEMPVDLELITDYMKTYDADHKKLAQDSWWVQDMKKLLTSHQNSHLDIGKFGQLATLIENYYKSKNKPVMIPENSYDAIPMLAFIFHRWDLHPLLYKNTDLLKNIKSMQAKFLEELIEKASTQPGDEKWIASLIRKQYAEFTSSSDGNIYQFLKDTLKF